MGGGDIGHQKIYSVQEPVAPLTYAFCVSSLSSATTLLFPLDVIKTRAQVCCAAAAAAAL